MAQLVIDRAELVHAVRAGMAALDPQEARLGERRRRGGIGKQPGDKASIALWKDEEPRELVVPPELGARMKKAGVLSFFESLSFTNRKEYSRWIADAKKDETRARRIDKAIELLSKGVRNPH